MAEQDKSPQSGVPPIPEGFEEVPRGLASSEVMGVPMPRMLTEPFTDPTPPIPEQFATSSPGTGERIKEVGIGLAQGAVKAAPATAGMVYGAKLGAALAPFTGMAAPAMPFVGGGIGLVGGFLLGEQLDDFFPAPSREDTVPYREAGITAGSMMTGANAAFYMRGDQATRIGRIIDYMGRTARARPKTYLGTEALSAVTAGAAGGAAESRFPGEFGPRFWAEFVASAFTPGKFFINSASTAYDGLKSIIRTARDPQNLQLKQANALYDVLDRVLTEVPAIRQLEELGTPQALQQAQELRGRYYKNLIKELEKVAPGLPGVEAARPTAAQKTGDLGLSILELSLAKGDKAFGSVIRQQGLDAMRANQLLIDAMNNVPDQRFLAQAAARQAELYDSMVTERLNIAERNAADAVRKITVNSPQSRKAVGEVVKREVQTALDEAREYERRLWDDAIRATALRTVKTGARKGQVVERELVPKELLRSYLEGVSGMTIERATGGMPAELRGIMARLGITPESIAAYQKGKLTPQYLETGVVPDEYLIAGVEVLKNGKTRVIPLGNKTTVQDLINIRSDMLAFARDAAAGTANRNPSDARFFGRLAEGALDDLQSLNSAVYDKARTFSKSLNDAFRRTYANQITAVERSGADKVPAEILVSRAFGRDSDITALRMDQIEGAVGFFKRKYDEAVAQFGPRSKEALELQGMAEAASTRVASVSDAMEKALRAAISDPTILNPQTGRINAQALANWMARNQEVLAPFGSLTNDLKNALDAENAFRLLGDPNSAINKQIRDQQAFAALLPGGERPTYAVTSVLDSANPVSGIRKLVNVAKDTKQGGGQAAIDGLKSSLLEYAYTQAGGTSPGRFSIQAFDDALFQPLAPAQPSIVKIMRETGLMSLTEIKNLRRVLEPMKKVESAMTNRVYLDKIVENTGPVGDLAVRMLALHGTSNIIPQGPGSLAAASAISRAAQDVFNQLPRLNALAALKETIQDPQLTAALLRVGRTDAEKLAILQNVKDRMSATGLIFTAGTRAVIPASNLTPQARQDAAERRSEAAKMLSRMPGPAPSTRGVPFLQQGQPPAAGNRPGGAAAPTQAPPPAPAPGQPPGSAATMLQQLFPFDTISNMAAARQQPM